MKSISLISKALLFTSIFSTSGLLAQEVEFFYLERGVGYVQTGPDTVSLVTWGGPYFGYAGADTVNGTFQSFELGINGVFQNIPFDPEDSDGYEIAGEYSTLSELQSELPAGNYAFRGIKGDGTNFQLDVQLPATNLPAVTKVTNFNALQNADSTQPIVVEWTPFNPGTKTAVLEISIGYYDQATDDVVDVYEVPGSRSDGIPGIEPTTSTFTIPANTLQGSPDNRYFAEMEYLLAETLEPAGSLFPDAQLAVLQSVYLEFDILTMTATTPSWGGYDWANETGDVTTGTFLGWINVAKAPWVYSYSLGKYIYSNEPNSNAPGAWVFVGK